MGTSYASYSCAASSSASEISACVAATSVANAGLLLDVCSAGELAAGGLAARVATLGLMGLVAALITGFGGCASSVAAITVVFSGAEALGKTIAPLNQLIAIKCRRTAAIKAGK